MTPPACTARALSIAWLARCGNDAARAIDHLVAGDTPPPEPEPPALAPGPSLWDNGGGYPGGAHPVTGGGGARFVMMEMAIPRGVVGGQIVQVWRAALAPRPRPRPRSCAHALLGIGLKHTNDADKRGFHTGLCRCRRPAVGTSPCGCPAGLGGLAVDIREMGVH